MELILELHSSTSQGTQLKTPFLNWSSFRHSNAPKVNGLEPIIVVFEHQREKESLWAKIRENPKKSKVIVTQFNSKKVNWKKNEKDRQRHENKKNIKIFQGIHKNRGYNNIIIRGINWMMHFQGISSTIINEQQKR